MRRLTLAAGLLFTLAASPAQAADGPGYAINDSGRSVSHACAPGERVAIAGSDNTVTLTGPCDKIAIAGAGNKLSAESVDKIAIAGADNTVTLDAVGKIAVTGSKNTVTWKRGLTGAKAPTIANLGSDNTISRKE